MRLSPLRSHHFSCTTLRVAYSTLWPVIHSVFLYQDPRLSQYKERNILHFFPAKNIRFGVAHCVKMRRSATDPEDAVCKHNRYCFLTEKHEYFTQIERFKDEAPRDFEKGTQIHTEN